MTVPLFWRSRSSRTAVIVFLLLISLAAASLLALQAQFSDVYHRATAEGVLHDYSSLVADEVIRRSAAEIGYYGYYPLLQVVRRQAEQSDDLTQIKNTLLKTQDGQLKRALSLAKSYFQMDLPNGQIAFVGEQPGDDAVAWLRQSLPGIPMEKNGPGLQVFNTQIKGSPRTFVAVATRGLHGGERGAGFEVDLSALTPWFATALNRQPLVPPSLGHGKVTNAFVHLSVRDHGGVERFRSSHEDSPQFAVTKPFGDVYQGIFSGFTVQAAIDPQVSRQIVIGGLPRSRLPFFLGVLALNAGLIVTAILQLRREMALQQLRDEFVSSVSHELRTPLTQIRMFTETLLLDRIRSDEERHRSLEIIDREARRLTQLVENVLQFSRAERKIDSLSKQKRELAPLIQEIVDDFESVVPGDLTRFECRLAFALTANIDPDAFRQVVINLLDNAVKYGRKQQQVIVRLEERNRLACLSVDDEGPGVPEEDRKRIFEHFQRLERDRQSATAGTGIGLSVVKDIAEHHGGRCWVTSGERGGAKFVVELPLATEDGSGLKKSAEALR
ncbi:MAG TPA: HAMP domain-containing sensor histidine kinase [Candidatus Angelobacter sp.]